MRRQLGKNAPSNQQDLMSQMKTDRQRTVTGTVELFRNTGRGQQWQRGRWRGCRGRNDQTTKALYRSAWSCQVVLAIPTVTRLSRVGNTATPRSWGCDRWAVRNRHPHPFMRAGTHVAEAAAHDQVSQQHHDARNAEQLDHTTPHSITIGAKIQASPDDPEPPPSSPTFRAPLPTGSLAASGHWRPSGARITPFVWGGEWPPRGLQVGASFIDRRFCGRYKLTDRNLRALRAELMLCRGRRLVSLVCLLAYVCAGVQATVSASCGCSGHVIVPPGEPSRREAIGAKGPTGVCGSACTSPTARSCGTAGVAIFGAPLQRHHTPPPPDDGDFSGCPACPGQCHLCSTGAIPFCFTPAFALFPPDCLGRFIPELLLPPGQACPDELIRPPMC